MNRFSNQARFRRQTSTFNVFLWLADLWAMHEIEGRNMLEPPEL